MWSSPGEGRPEGDWNGRGAEREGSWRENGGETGRSLEGDWRVYSGRLKEDGGSVRVGEKNFI
jgi:hypothetical protein